MKPPSLGCSSPTPRPFSLMILWLIHHEIERGFSLSEVDGVRSFVRACPGRETPTKRREGRDRERLERIRFDFLSTDTVPFYERFLRLGGRSVSWILVSLSLQGTRRYRVRPRFSVLSFFFPFSYARLSCTPPSPYDARFGGLVPVCPCSTESGRHSQASLSTQTAVMLFLFFSLCSLVCAARRHWTSGWELGRHVDIVRCLTARRERGNTITARTARARSMFECLARLFFDNEVMIYLGSYTRPPFWLLTVVYWNDKC